MADTPVLAPWNDQQSTIELPGFRKRSMRTVTDSKFLRFEGDVAPRGFRSEALYRIWQVEALFWRTQHSTANQLNLMLQTAAQSSDARLYFDHGGVLADVIPFAFAVECHEWDLSFPQPGSGIVLCRFDLTEVSN